MTEQEEELIGANIDAKSAAASVKGKNSKLKIADGNKSEGRKSKSKKRNLKSVKSFQEDS